MSEDSRVEKWKSWIEVIQRDVGHLLLRRTLFKDLLKMRAKNPRLVEHGDAFFAFVSDLFVDSVVVGIRRQLKPQKESISLVRLLSEFAETPELLSRERYLGLWKVTGNDSMSSLMAAGEFKRLAGGGEHLDRAIPTQDIDELKQVAEACEEYADRRIAHWDARAPGELAPKTVYDSLDSLRELVKKYYLLLYASGLEVEPVLQLPIWYAFTFPWMPPPPGEGGRR